MGGVQKAALRQMYSSIYIYYAEILKNRAIRRHEIFDLTWNL